MTKATNLAMWIFSPWIFRTNYKLRAHGNKSLELSSWDQFVPYPPDTVKTHWLSWSASLGFQLHIFRNLGTLIQRLYHLVTFCVLVQKEDQSEDQGNGGCVFNFLLACCCCCSAASVSSLYVRLKGSVSESLQDREGGMPRPKCSRREVE